MVDADLFLDLENYAMAMERSADTIHVGTDLDPGNVGNSFSAMEFEYTWMRWHQEESPPWRQSLVVVRHKGVMSLLRHIAGTSMRGKMTRMCHTRMAYCRDLDECSRRHSHVPYDVGHGCD